MEYEMELKDETKFGEVDCLILPFAKVLGGPAMIAAYQNARIVWSTTIISLH
jgi:hypothetical protein